MYCTQYVVQSQQVQVMSTVDYLCMYSDLVLIIHFHKPVVCMLKRVSQEFGCVHCEVQDMPCLQLRTEPKLTHMHTHHLVTKWQTIRTDSSICIQVEYLCHIMYVEGFVA